MLYIFFVVGKALSDPVSHIMYQSERGGVYGAPRVFLGLREAGETCGKHRVARIMRENEIKALRGYKAPAVMRRPKGSLSICMGMPRLRNWISTSYSTVLPCLGVADGGQGRRHSHELLARQS